MPHKKTAIVVVSKEWVNSGVHHLINDGHPSIGTGQGHLLILPLEDETDPKGLWLADITTTRLTKDDSPVTMKFLVPWSFIYGVGIVEGEKPDVKMGFQTIEALPRAE